MPRSWLLFFGFDLRKPVDVLGDAVGIGIVAVAGRVLQHFLNRLIPHEVGVHRVEHLTHGQPLFLKDELLDRGEGVHHGRVAEEFEVRIIDAAFDLLGMQILHVLHAEVVQHGGTAEPRNAAGADGRRCAAAGKPSATD